MLPSTSPSPSPPPAPPGLDSQVMSPNADPGRDRDQEVRRDAEPYMAFPAVEAPPTQAALPWESEDPLGTGAADAAKQKIVFRPLDTGRAEDYDSWRHALRAEVVAAAPDTGRAMGYIAAIDQRAIYPDAHMYEAVQMNKELRALDARVYGALLECIRGNGKQSLEARIRAQGRPYAGCLALRILDDWFQRNAQKRAALATRALINLAPTARGAAAMDGFFAQYRLLLHQAGADNVGPEAQIDILQRAVEDHPKLGMTWAAWREAGSRDPDALLMRLEESTADGMHGASSARPGATAWAAIEASCTSAPVPAARDAPWPPTACATAPAPSRATPLPTAAHAAGEAWRAAAHVAAGPPASAVATSSGADKRCFRCGEWGHVQRDCDVKKTARGRGGSGADKQDAMMGMMAELIAEMRAARQGGATAQPKK